MLSTYNVRPADLMEVLNVFKFTFECREEGEGGSGKREGGACLMGRIY